jgi:2-methylisocitrate lyase-like PEP mutase family enzyme
MPTTHARRFATLHAGPDLLILPNAWDATSALIAQHAGAKAIATSSAAVAWTHGYPDGEALPVDRHLATVSAIARVISVPLSVDFEAGYARDATKLRENIGRLLDAGAVGVNMEDGTEPPEVLCATIAAAKSAAAAKGSELWINARTDVALKKLTAPEAALAEIITRAKRYLGAGADSIFVPAVVAEDTLATLAKEVPAPLNVLAWSGLPPAATLQRLGVRRLSAGGHLARATYNHALALAKAFLADGASSHFDGPGLSGQDFNAMMKRN